MATASPRKYGTLREILIAAGVGQFSAPLAIQFMSFLPRTCDPNAQGVLLLVQGLQRLLNKAGSTLKVSGTMGDDTARALMIYAGPRWYDKNWTELYQAVLAGKHWEGWKRRDRYDEPPQLISETPSLDGVLDSVTGFLTSPIGLVAAGLAGLAVWNMRRSR